MRGASRRRARTTARSCVTGAKPKLPVIRRCTRSARPLPMRSSRYFPRRSTATTTSPSSSSATSKRSYGRVRRGSRISTRASARPSRRGASCARIVSTSGSSGTTVLSTIGIRSRERDRPKRLKATAVRPRRSNSPTGYATTSRRIPCGCRAPVADLVRGEDRPPPVPRRRRRGRERRRGPDPPRPSGLASRSRRRRPRGRPRRPSCDVPPRARAPRSRSTAPTDA